MCILTACLAEEVISKTEDFSRVTTALTRGRVGLIPQIQRERLLAFNAWFRILCSKVEVQNVPTMKKTPPINVDTGTVSP